MRGKIFTRVEADRMVPLIRRIALHVRARQRLIPRKKEQAAALDPGQRGSRSGSPDARASAVRLRREVELLESALRDCVVELDDLGCSLVDAETGVVTCYGELEGEVVHLTWEPGHDAFLQWFALDTTHLKRQPLPGVQLPPSPSRAS